MKKTASLLVAILILSLIPSFAFADSEISVTGTGEVLVPADTAVVSLGVSAADKDVRTAQSMANEAIAAIRSALIEGDIAEEDINTDYINIYAMYDYQDDREKLAAYNASSTLAIKVTDLPWRMPSQRRRCLPTRRDSRSGESRISPSRTLTAMIRAS